MITYTKRDIVRKVSEKSGIPMYKLEDTINDTLEAVQDILMSADPECRIELRGFGVFTVKVTKAKPSARNPKTGETIYVPKHRKIHFSAGKTLDGFLKQSLEEVEGAEQ